MHETAPVPARLSTGEFLVIVIILAIVAAIVIPPYTRADTSAANATGAPAPAPVSGLGLRCADDGLAFNGGIGPNAANRVDPTVSTLGLAMVAESRALRRA